MSLSCFTWATATEDITKQKVRQMLEHPPDKRPEKERYKVMKPTNPSRGNHRPAKRKLQSKGNPAPKASDTEEQLLARLIGKVCTAEAVAAAKVADQTLGDYVCEKLSRTDDDALPGGLSATLPPLRGQPEFPRYSVNQVASLPCGAHVLRQKLKQFWTKE